MNYIDLCKILIKNATKKMNLIKITKKISCIANRIKKNYRFLMFFFSFNFEKAKFAIFVLISRSVLFLYIG